MPGSGTSRDVSFYAHAILGESTMIVEDAHADERFAQNPLVLSEPNIRFYAGAPFVDRDGFGLGSLCVIDRVPRTLDDRQQEALEALARQVLAHFELTRVSSELATALKESRVLHGLLPICAHCKHIRNDGGYWKSVEDYISTHSEASFSHGICPECIKSHYPEVWKSMQSGE